MLRKAAPEPPPTPPSAPADDLITKEFELAAANSMIPGCEAALAQADAALLVARSRRRAALLDGNDAAVDAADGEIVKLERAHEAATLRLGGARAHAEELARDIDRLRAERAAADRQALFTALATRHREAAASIRERVLRLSVDLADFFALGGELGDLPGGSEIVLEGRVLIGGGLHGEQNNGWVRPAQFGFDITVRPMRPLAGFQAETREG